MKFLLFIRMMVLINSTAVPPPLPISNSPISYPSSPFTYPQSILSFTLIFLCPGSFTTVFLFSPLRRGKQSRTFHIFPHVIQQLSFSVAFSIASYLKGMGLRILMFWIYQLGRANRPQCLRVHSAIYSNSSSSSFFQPSQCL